MKWRSRRLARVVGRRMFRLLWAGQATSYLGDQFYLIALPWLVLRLTGDPLVLGTVLAAAGIPRAVLLLLGGAITDRFSPRLVMIATDLGRFVLTAGLAALVCVHIVQLWSLYLFALVFGALAGLFMPASSTITPSILEKDALQVGNALMQGSAQLAAVLGPLLAGGTIVLLAGGRNGSPEMVGITVALGIDACTFLVSIVTLWLMGPLSSVRQAAPQEEAEVIGAPTRTDMLAAIGGGLHYAWRNSLVRLALVLVASINMFCTGPLLVGIPVLAAQRLTEGAEALGILMSAYAGGNLAGYLLAGTLPRPRRLRRFVPLLLSAFGLVFGVLGLLDSTPVLALVLLTVGGGTGYMAILVMTWLQEHTPQELLGRTMSLLLLANLGFVPLSQALAGAVVGWSLVGLFLSAGVLVLALAILLAFSKELRAADLYSVRLDSRAD